MAITPTGAIYKTLTFDGESSADYGVYITGQAVFNAPEREVEMITIPGRNGTFALDKGRFENVTVTYPAGIFADTDEDFSEAISDFRNWLCSRQGYVRLEDDYNPNEYRLAVYKSGLEVELAQLKAGEFNIVFECKPQRFLKSGETEITVTSGDDITNPTLFDAHPELQVVGYGTINIGGKEIIITNKTIGDIVVGGMVTYPLPYLKCDIDAQFANNNNWIIVNNPTFYDVLQVDSGTIESVSVTVSNYGSYTVQNYGSQIGLTISKSKLVYTYNFPQTETFNVTAVLHTSSYGDLTVTINHPLAYDGDDEFISNTTITLPTHISGECQQSRVGDIVLRSTKSALGNPMYIDLDIGEAYKVENGSVASVNDAVSMSAELPMLPPGSTTFTYDNTITSFKIVPRWWQI